MEDTNFSREENIFGEKVEGVEYTDRTAVYGIVADIEGKVAVIKTPRGYFLPGGGVEIGESHITCLKREFIEETGYEISVQDYIGKASLYHVSRSQQYLHGIGFFYKVELECKMYNKTEEDHELVWLEAKECIDNLFLEHQGWAVSKALK